MVQYLVSMGANIHALNDYGFHWACQNSHLDVVQYLVSILGANIHNIINKIILKQNIQPEVRQYLESILRTDAH